jgi:hypothetical protein
MTEADDPRTRLPKRLRDHLDHLFSPNWTLALASAVLSYEFLEKRGVSPADCEALGKLCMANGRQDLWLTKPGGEEAAEALLQAMKVYPPGHQRPGVVASLAKSFAFQGLIADPHRWFTGEPESAQEMLARARAGLQAPATLSDKGLDEAVEAIAAFRSLKSGET